MENIPENSHLKFDGLTSFSTYVGPQNMENWGGNWLTTYLELPRETDIAGLESKFPAYLISHMGEERAKSYELFLQPLREVHANSSDITHDYINHQKFDGAYTLIFFYIAIIVLFIAAINFVNLSSAKSMGRAMEIGVRKVSGATRTQLYLQFVGESVLISLLALLFAIGLVAVALPFLNQFSQRNMDFPVFHDPLLFVSLVMGAALVGILSGMYPALYLAAFRPVKVLKGSPEGGKKKFGFRNVLVVTQFSAAIFLIIATLFATRQLRYMQDKDIGFSHSQVVTVPLNGQYNARYESFKQELLSNSLIEKVTASGQRLGNNLHQTSVTFHGDGPARSLASSQVVVDPDFLDVYQIELVAGRNFHPGKTDNGKAYIINESLAKELLLNDGGDQSMETLLGRHFGFSGMDSSGQIVGIARDFNFNSLHHKIETLCLFNQQDWGYGEVSVKINGLRARESLAYMESVWNSIIPEREFEYECLDDHFTELYRADRTVSVIVGMLTVLSILISCLGLFGLASYTTEQRVKEIGIRKVLGASVSMVVALLSKDLVKLVVIAILIAIPVAWFAVNRWLRGFAYRIEIEWWVFATAGLTAVLIALLTVSIQSVKAALANPVDSLKSE